MTTIVAELVFWLKLAAVLSPIVVCTILIGAYGAAREERGRGLW